MHQTASECQLQISLAMQRNRCTRHLDHKSLGWEKLMKIMRGHSKPNYPAEGSLLWFSIHLTSDYTVMFTSFTHPESSWIARQYSAPHAKHCWQSLQRRQPRIANSTAIRYLSPADLVEKVKKLWSIRISKDCFQQRYYIYIYICINIVSSCFLWYASLAEHPRRLEPRSSPQSQETEKKPCLHAREFIKKEARSFLQEWQPGIDRRTESTSWEKDWQFVHFWM